MLCIRNADGSFRVLWKLMTRTPVAAPRDARSKAKTNDNAYHE